MSVISPFLKWAGGKRWLVGSRPDLFPKQFNRYFEPFLGSGAVFFHLQPSQAILTDCNQALIETYQALKNDWKDVQQELKRHQENHCKSYYYKIRTASFMEAARKAAQFIYLNRTCWNGLYRVNLSGQFNVPIGTKSTVLFPGEDFAVVSRSLKNTKLKVADFEETIGEANRGDFVFVDPPYTVKHNNNNFIKYNEELFSWQDQIRLQQCLTRARSRGAGILVTNANHSSVRKLYRNVGKLTILSRQSIIAADKENRKSCEELIIRM